jgi:hypothetical protein
VELRTKWELYHCVRCQKFTRSTEHHVVRVKTKVDAETAYLFRMNFAFTAPTLIFSATLDRDGDDIVYYGAGSVYMVSRDEPNTSYVCLCTG